MPEGSQCERCWQCDKMPGQHPSMYLIPQHGLLSVSGRQKARLQDLGIGKPEQTRNRCGLTCVQTINHANLRNMSIA